MSPRLWLCAWIQSRINIRSHVKKTPAFKIKGNAARKAAAFPLFVQFNLELDFVLLLNARQLATQQRSLEWDRQVLRRLPQTPLPNQAQSSSVTSLFFQLLWPSPGQGRTGWWLYDVTDIYGLRSEQTAQFYFSPESYIWSQVTGINGKFTAIHCSA